MAFQIDVERKKICSKSITAKSTMKTCLADKQKAKKQKVTMWRAHLGCQDGKAWNQTTEECCKWLTDNIAFFLSLWQNIYQRKTIFNSNSVVQINSSDSAWSETRDKTCQEQSRSCQHTTRRRRHGARQLAPPLAPGQQLSAALIYTSRRLLLLLSSCQLVYCSYLPDLQLSAALIYTSCCSKLHLFWQLSAAEIYARQHLLCCRSAEEAKVVLNLVWLLSNMVQVCIESPKNNFQTGVSKIPISNIIATNLVFFSGRLQK